MYKLRTYFVIEQFAYLSTKILVRDFVYFDIT